MHGELFHNRQQQTETIHPTDYRPQRRSLLELEISTNITTDLQLFRNLSVQMPTSGKVIAGRAGDGP